MTYWDEKEYWAEASTRNCIWLFQIKDISRNCDCATDEDDERDCGHEVTSWRTQCVFLNKQEAKDWGNSRVYEWGKELEGWKVYGVPCYGEMAKALAPTKGVPFSRVRGLEFDKRK